MKNKIFLSALVLLATTNLLFAGPGEEGKTIFSTRCAACHNVNKQLTGPALGGVDKRHSIEWIVQFVQSSQTLVRNGDKEAVALFQQFNSIPMPDHPDLDADDIKNVVAYIKSQEVVADSKAPFDKPTRLMTAYRPVSPGQDYVMVIAYFITVLLLIGVLLFAVHLRSLKPSEEDV